MNRPAVSVIGLGAMGSALAATLLRLGHPTTVWNRSPGRVDALSALGAEPARTAADAAAASPLVLVSVTDYAASAAVIDSIGDANGDFVGDTAARRVIVNLTTGSPDEARALERRVGRRGADYVDGVVQAGPSQIGTPAATMLYAGAREAYERHEPTLDQLGTATYVGSDAGLACLHDLALLGLWYEAELAVLNALALVGGSSDAETFLPFAGRQIGYVVESLPELAREVRERDYPAGPASLTEHAPVLERLVQLREASGMNADQLRHVTTVVRRLIREGNGGDGFTRVHSELGGDSR